jgi:hypothetical protein
LYQVIALAISANSTTITTADITVNAVATISTIGLALCLGIATILPAAYRLMTELKPHEIRRSRPMRMMRLFSRWRYILGFFVLAVLHMAAGLEVLFYLDLDYGWILWLGKWTSTFALALTIVGVGIVVWNAHSYSQKDMDEEAEAQSVLARSNPQTPQASGSALACKKCGNINPLGQYCLKCGEPTGVVSAPLPSP